MKFNFLLISIVIGIMVVISLPEAVAIDKTNSITKNVPVTKIILVTKYSDHVRVSYSFFITSKVFYANQNPSGNFDQYYGFVPNAKLTVQILDPNGVLKKTLSGVTDNHGYFYQTYRIPDNSRVGTYTILVSAQVGDATDSKNLPLFIQPHRQS
ncbi:MAG TPA: hypothetical protein VK431_01740 [Nitrosopumilaceae archaeon]|nr:hypothetical protein [Nitrosopumilaceae archaeon]